jgi:hypothetical protein
MIWLSLFLACQHLNSGTNLRECEDQSWFKVQAVPEFRFDVRLFYVSTGYSYPRLKTTDLDYRGIRVRFETREILLFFTASRLALGPIQSVLPNEYWGIIPLGGPSSAKIKNAWSYISTPFHSLQSCCIKQRDLLYTKCRAHTESLIKIGKG